MQLKLSHLTVAAFTISFAFSAAAEETPNLALSANGEARATIVVSATPSPAAKKAAKVLAEHLHQISGARFDVVDDAKIPEDTNYIAVGESSLTQSLGVSAKGLGAGGIRIRTFPNALVLLGPDQATPLDPNGTLYAVTTFLEDSLGCRFLWPGELGKVVPHNKSMVVRPIDRSMTPMLQQRRIRNMSWGDRDAAGIVRLGVTAEEYHRQRSTAEATVSEDGGWFTWQRLGGSLGLPGGHAFTHAWEKWSKDHPAWFALQANGSRDQSQFGTTRSRFCVSNLELIDAIANEKIEELNRQGSRPVKAVSIGPNDGGRASFCMCESCKKLDAPDGNKVMLWDFTSGKRRDFQHVSLTDRYVWFWNEIAKRVCKVHPDAWLTADAYSVYTDPPRRRQLHPNVSIRFVDIAYTDDVQRKTGRARWDAWSEKASKIYFRPNLLLAARRQGTPMVYVHKMGEDFCYLAHHSMIGTDMDACTHNWATQGLNFYIAARLHWNPDLNVDEEIDDYCRTGFGSAVDPVKRYFARLEKLTDQIAAAEPALHPTAPYTAEVITELSSLLDEADRAAAAVGDGEKVLKRIAFLRRGLDYAEIHSAGYHLLAELNETGKLTPELRARATEVLNRNYEFSREIFYKDFLAVNVARIAWGGWGYFGRLGWRSPAVK
jgi:hypothetical protein